MGTIIVVEAEPVLKSQKVAISARVSFAEHRTNLEQQVERLLHYCKARGSLVSQVVKELASGVNDSRPKLLRLLKDTSVTLMVVNMAENDKEDLIADLVAIVYRFTARQNGTHCAGNE